MEVRRETHLKWYQQSPARWDNPAGDLLVMVSLVVILKCLISGTIDWTSRTSPDKESAPFSKDLMEFPRSSKLERGVSALQKGFGHIRT